MPTPKPADLRLGVAAPLDTVAAFEQRKLLEPSFRWQDVFQEEHGRAFAVAGVMRLDVLQAFQAELLTSLQEGRSLADFRGRMRSRLAELGFSGPQTVTDPQTGEERTIEFDSRRLRTIFEVNLRQSEAAGRWARIERNKRRFPYVMYRTMRDERVRALHRRWDGVTLPVDDPWWDTHYPPCGWRCRCRAFAVSERDIERFAQDGLPVQRSAPPDRMVRYVNPRTGEIAQVPLGVDPGFAYNPGKRRDAELQEQLLLKALKAPPLAGAVAASQAAADHAGMVLQATRDFSAFVDQVLAAGQAAGAMRQVGSLRPGVVRALEDNRIDLSTATISVRDRDVLDNAAARPELYRLAPKLLADARAVLLDKRSGGLLYVSELIDGDGTVTQVALLLDRRDKLVLLRTVTVMELQTLRDRSAYELVWGQL